MIQGPDQQFIIGAAGTGKTILLQAKALELLQQGGSVTVLTQAAAQSRWRSLFSDYDQSRYKIFEFQTFVRNVLRDGRPNETRKFTGLRGYLGLDRDVPSHIFIDDALADQTGSPQVLLISLFLMTIWNGNLSRPGNVIWVALDPNRVSADAYAQDSIYDPRSGTMKDFLEVAMAMGMFKMSLLNQVLRCSVGVFGSAYPDLVQPVRENFSYFSLDNFRPVLEHKIQGLSIPQFRKKSASFDVALKILSTQLLSSIHRLTDSRIDLSQRRRRPFWQLLYKERTFQTRRYRLSPRGIPKSSSGHNKRLRSSFAEYIDNNDVVRSVFVRVACGHPCAIFDHRIRRW